MSELLDLIDAGRDLGPDILIDAGKLSRDPDGDTDGTFDPDTLVANVPADDEEYWTGPCLITPEQAAPVTVGPGVAQRAGRFRVLLEHTAPLPTEGDYWTATASVDATLVDERMRVVEVVQSTALVFRTFYVTAIAPAAAT